MNLDQIKATVLIFTVKKLSYKYSMKDDLSSPNEVPGSSPITGKKKKRFLSDRFKYSEQLKNFTFYFLYYIYLLCRH